MKRYKYTFPIDADAVRFYQANVAPTLAAGGTLWYSLTFEEPGEKPLIMLELPDELDAATVAPLPDGAAWTPDAA